MESKELFVGARVFVRRWIKSSFRHSAFPFSPVRYSICSWIVLPDPSFQFYCSRPSFFLSLSSPAFFSTSSSCIFFWSLIIVVHILFFFSSRSLDEVSMTSPLFKYQKATRSYRWPQRLIIQSALDSHLFSLFCVCFSSLWKIFNTLFPKYIGTIAILFLMDIAKPNNWNKAILARAGG